jgi:hypothetical protein
MTNETKDREFAKPPSWDEPRRWEFQLIQNEFDRIVDALKIIQENHRGQDLGLTTIVINLDEENSEPGLMVLIREYQGEHMQTQMQDPPIACYKIDALFGDEEASPLKRIDLVPNAPSSEAKQ